MGVCSGSFDGEGLGRPGPARQQEKDGKERMQLSNKSNKHVSIHCGLIQQHATIHNNENLVRRKTNLMFEFMCKLVLTKPEKSL